jgi:hypothetical protein
LTRFRLSYSHYEIGLSPGHHLIGRYTGCAIALDDRKVSRRHARLVVTDEEAFIDDLCSTHGVRVNGTRIHDRRRLSHGSWVQIGDQVLTFVDLQSPRARAASEQPVTPHDEVAYQVDSLRVLGGWALRALSAGRADEAERILSVRLARILEVTGKAPAAMPADVVEQATEYASQLAVAGQASWSAYASRLRAAKSGSLPLTKCLQAISPKLGVVDLHAVDRYLTILTKPDEAPPAPTEQADPDKGPRA